MATAYPNALDNFTNPTSGNKQDSLLVPHSLQHSNINDAIEAVEAELGTNPKAGYASVKARLAAIDAAIAGVAVTAANALTDGTVTTNKLGTGAVTAAKITDGTITKVKMASDSVGSAQIEALSVTSAKLADNAVTLSKLPVGFRGITTCTTATRPAHSAGLYIFETDTNRTLMSNGVGWIIMNEPGNSIVATGTGWAKGNGSALCDYHRSDGWCDAVFQLTLGTTSTVTGEFVFNLPVSAAAGSYLADGFFTDAGVGTLPIVTITAPGTITLRAVNAAGTYSVGVATSATVPFTWTTTDYVTVTIRYRMSSRYG